MAILRNVTLEFVPEAIRFLQNRGLPCEPQSAAQAGIAILGYLASTAKHAGLDGSKIHTAELQELAVMVEPPQIAGLGQNGVNGGVKTGHAAAQNQASGEAPSAMARALPK